MEVAYRRRMTGAGTSYQERKQDWTQCTECREELVIRLLAGHIKTKHGREEEGIRRWEAMAPSGYPHTYRMDFPNAGGPRN